jgi:hypothetical protein
MPRIFSLSDKGNSNSGCSASSERRSAPDVSCTHESASSSYTSVLLVAQPLHRRALHRNGHAGRRSIPEGVRRLRCAAAVEKNCNTRHVQGSGDLRGARIHLSHGKRRSSGRRSGNAMPKSMSAGAAAWLQNAPKPTKIG